MTNPPAPYHPVTKEELGQTHKRKKGANHFGYGHQISLGKTKEGAGIWHSHGKTYHNPNTYWSGNWGDRTPEELKTECESTLSDMRRYHPELFVARPDTLEVLEKWLQKRYQKCDKIDVLEARSLVQQLRTNPDAVIARGKKEGGLP